MGKFVVGLRGLIQMFLSVQLVLAILKDNEKRKIRAMVQYYNQTSLIEE